MLQVASLIFGNQHLREAPELALQGNLVAEWSCIAKRRAEANLVWESPNTSREEVMTRHTKKVFAHERHCELQVDFLKNILQ